VKLTAAQARIEECDVRNRGCVYSILSRMRNEDIRRDTDHFFPRIK